MSNKMGKEKRGPLALELWAKQLIDSYPNICIRNMTTSWRNGLAFCALINKHRPDLITDSDYDKLDPSDIIGNCSLAFEVAESKLGIPSLLDPLDMAAMDVPDRLSVLTYVAQFYNAFKNSDAKSRLPSRRSDELDGQKDKTASPNKPEKVVTKRKNEELDVDEIMDKAKRNIPNRSMLLSTSNVCYECKNPVFISERVLFMKKLYHRSCFSCSNCKNPLNPHIVDISSDGSLFCLEKTCHAELLRQIDNSVNKPKNNSDTNDTITPNTENNPRPNLNDASEMMMVVVDDSKSQGDMQIFPEKEEISPQHSASSTPANTRRLMDFAGSLLHEDNISSTLNQSEKPQSESESSSEEEEEDNSESNEDCTTNLDNEEKKANLSNENLNFTKETEQGVLISPAEPKQYLSDEIIEKTEKFSEGCGAKFPSSENSSNESMDSNTANNNSATIEAQKLTIADQIKASAQVAINVANSEINQPKINIVESEESSNDSLLNNSSILSDDIDNADTLINSEDSPSQTSIISSEIVQQEKQDSLQNPFEEDNEEEKVSNLILTSPDASSESPKPQSRPPKPPPPKFTPSPTPRPRNLPKVSQSCSSSSKMNQDYPAELNPFEDDEQQPPTADSKNPFEEDDDNEPVPSPSPIPKPRTFAQSEINNNASNAASPVTPRKNAANFNVPPPRPPPPQTSSPRKSAPAAVGKSYNPFEDDVEEGQDDYIGDYESNKIPVDDTSSISSKTSDLSSISGVPTPIPRSLNTSDTEGTGSVKARSRKSRRAPLPPSMTQTEAQNPDSDLINAKPLTPDNTKKIIPVSPKLLKGLTPSPLGQTQRKKRRAPPPRRRVEPLPEATIKTEFADLEIKLKELERQGISLESTIRSIEEQNEDNEEESEEKSNEQLDEMMIQLWNIVNEKNDILRRQTELEYLRRGHRLEEMQSELEFKFRVLMDTPDDQKQPNHAEMEQVYLQQLLKLVDERNEVVEWLDYHRKQEKEEELLLTKSITEFASTSSKPVEPIPEPFSPSKLKKKKDKHKDENKEKKEHKLKLGIFKKKKKPKTGDTNKSEP